MSIYRETLCLWKNRFHIFVEFSTFPQSFPHWDVSTRVDYMARPIWQWGQDDTVGTFCHRRILRMGHSVPTFGGCSVSGSVRSRAAAAAKVHLRLAGCLRMYKRVCTHPPYMYNTFVVWECTKGAAHGPMYIKGMYKRECT